MGKQGKPWQTIFWGSKITADGDCGHEIKRRLLLGRKTMTNLDSNIKKQRHYFADKGPSNQCCGFSSSHVWMWELDYKESWELKNWCFWTVVLEKIIESPMDCKKIKPVNPKGNQSWILIGRTGAETPILWPPDSKNWLLRKDLDAGKDWRQEEKGDKRGWDGWMALLTWWTWVWAGYANWRWTVKPGMLQSMGSQSRTWLWLNWTFLYEKTFLFEYTKVPLCSFSLGFI